MVADAKHISSIIESPDHKNPFYRVRTELYGNDYKLIAKAFAQPERTLYELVQGNTSVYLFGGRGVGKTMLLKSLTPAVLCPLLGVKSFKDILSKGIHFLGFYFRLKRGSLTYCNYGPPILMAINKLGVPFNYDEYKDLVDKAVYYTFEESSAEPILAAAFDILRVISSNELNYKLLDTILLHLSTWSSDSLLPLATNAERTIAERVMKLLEPKTSPKTASFEDLRGLISNELKKVEDYVQSQALPSSVRPVPDWIKTRLSHS